MDITPEDSISLLDYDYTKFDLEVLDVEESNSSNYVKVDDLSEDEDAEDNINIIINTLPRDEKINLKKILESNVLESISIPPSNNPYQLQADDLEVRNEISRLVKLSITPRVNKFIAILVDNQLILVPIDVTLSDRLAAHVWPPAKPYVKIPMPFEDEFNNLLIPNHRRTEKFAIFGVKYNKTNFTQYDRSSSFLDSTSKYTRYRSDDHFERQYDSSWMYMGQQNDADSGRIKQSSTGVYRYCDFSAIIIENNRVIDYAIHGFHSNIAEMIEIHKPRRVYYSAQPGDAFSVFMNYEYQPFYQCTRGISRAITIHRGRGNFNPLPFCVRQDAFCAFCNGLRDVRGFINNPDVSQSLKIPQQLRMFVKKRRHNYYDIACRQPIHNSRPRPLHAPKKNGRNVTIRRLMNNIG
ncbi:uncharacterized LOC105265027 [Fopius arisanus]|uniref:MurD_0 protein n=1 Tax=Fopius arisanus TaxID=64838 RepID=A0A0C9RAZ1_9HYME|nr:uncharacterized LOC105265027 [Fopius arisanus]KAG8362531.1 GbNV_gp78-like [Fopius arisanus]